MNLSRLVKIASIYISLLALSIEVTHAQSNASNELTKIDQSTGYYSLPYLNGKLHLNYDNTVAEKNHKYFGTNQFITGNINYNGGNYYGLKLKYDIKNDELVCLPDQDNDYVKVNLISENLNEFSLGNRNFINLTNALTSKFDKGFYEKTYNKNEIILYVKHSKKAIEIIKESKKQLEYFEKKEYIICIKERYYTLNSERDLITIFPENKSDIKNYYTKNQRLEKDDKTEFFVGFLKLLK